MEASSNLRHVVLVANAGLGVAHVEIGEQRLVQQHLVQVSLLQKSRVPKRVGLVFPVLVELQVEKIVAHQTTIVHRHTEELKPVTVCQYWMI